MPVHEALNHTIILCITEKHRLLVFIIIFLKFDIRIKHYGPFQHASS